MWRILKNLFIDELKRMWRHILRRPAPTGDFSRYRSRLSPDTTGDADPADTGAGNHGPTEPDPPAPENSSR